MQRELIRRHLLPGLRERAFFERQRLMAVLGGRAAQSFRPIADHLGVVPVMEVIAEGGSPTLRAVSQRRLGALGFTPRDAVALATENLRRRGRAQFRRTSAGLWRCRCGDGFDAARLLLVEDIASLRVAGPQVAAVPDADTLIVAGLYDARAMDALFAALAEEQPAAISGVPLLRDGTTWRRLVASRDAPWAPQLGRIVVAERLRDYERQREMMADLYRAAGQRIVLPPVDAPDVPGVPARTRCQWEQRDGDEALLPRADLVTFVSGAGACAEAVPWARIARVLGPELRPIPGLHPERFSLRFPAPNQLRALASG
jgi:hypothetical protein